MLDPAVYSPPYARTSLRLLHKALARVLHYAIRSRLHLLAFCILAHLFCINVHAQETAPTATPTPSATPTPAASPAPTASPAPAASPSPRPAVVKLRVGFETNKTTQPIGLKRFFLLRDDFEKLPAAASPIALSRSAYYLSIGASPALLAWLDANNCDFVYCREMEGADLSVPEFRQAYESGLRKWRNPERALKWLTVNLPEPVRIGYYNRRTPTVESLAAKARPIATVVTSEKGIGLLTDIAPGEYYVSNILPVEINGVCVLWNHKITVPPGKTGKDTTIVLANDNSKTVDCSVSRTAPPSSAATQSGTNP